MKILNTTVIILVAATGLAEQDYSLVAAEQNHQVQAFNQRVVHSEETQVTKEYVTALLLDGMRRVYEAGLDFVGKEPETAIRKVEAVRTLVKCAFDHALIPNDKKYWDDTYNKCVTGTGLVSGDLDNDYISILSFFHNNRPDSRYYKSAFFTSVLANSVVPGPLAVIYWAMERIGSVALSVSGREKEEFLSEIKRAIGFIEARSAMGKKAYISEMEIALTKLQGLIERHAKSNTNTQRHVLNLMNLRLTREGVSKLGQVALEETNRAQSSRILEAEKAKELALFVLKHHMISALVSLQAGTSLREYLDEVVATHKEVLSKFKALDSKAPIRMAAKTNVAQRTLMAYGFNDMNGVLNVAVEAAPLKDAFKIGRILGEEAKTSEYDAKARAGARVQEEAQRREMFEKSASSRQTQNLQIASGVDPSAEKQEL